MNVSKTELAPNPEKNHPPDILLTGVTLKSAELFKYLGSAVTYSNSSNIEGERRILSAAKSLSTLHK